MPFDPNRPICIGDYVEVSDRAKLEARLRANGPWRVVRLEQFPDQSGQWKDTAVIEADGKEYFVFESHCRLVAPPRLTLAEKELLAREPWQARRDDNLREIFSPARRQ